MHTSTLICALAAAALAGTLATAQAEAPKRLQADQSVAIDAPPAKVWAMVRDFANLTWHPAIKASSATQGNTPGSVRTLDLGGPKLVEQLIAYDAPDMQYTYRITEDPANVKALPVTSYVSTLSVRPDPSQGCIVDWRGSFMRADLSPNPQAGRDDAAALKAINDVYSAGLQRLKTEAEAD